MNETCCTCDWWRRVSPPDNASLCCCEDSRDAGERTPPNHSCEVWGPIVTELPVGAREGCPADLQVRERPAEEKR